MPNGWQSIGIILSLIWFIGFAGFAWISESRHRDDFHKSQLDKCYRNLTVKNEGLQYIERKEDRAKKEAANSTEYHNCTNEAAKIFGQQLKTADESVPVLVVLDFVTVVFGWLVAWFGIVITRWIRQGCE